MPSKKHRQTRKRSVRSRTPTPYPRPPRTTVHATQSYMNVTQTWKNGVGRRNTVVIRNGQGEKRVEQIGPNGQVLRTQTRKLSKPERNQILQGQFIPGLWRNCRLGSC